MRHNNQTSITVLKNTPLFGSVPINKKDFWNIQILGNKMFPNNPEKKHG